MPGAKQGLSDEDPTISELLKPRGFDEYAGVLYHLNALEEPENVDYPKDPAFFANFAPRD